MLIRQLSIFIENRKGRLAEITRMIADRGINIRTLNIADTESFGILRIIVDEPEKVEAELKAAGLTVSSKSVVLLSVPDRPGGLADALVLLAANDIEVEYMYGFTAHKSDNSECALMVLRVSDENTAERLLADAGYGSVSSVM